MTEKPIQILLVTPVWNDSARLETYGESLANALADSGIPIRWIIADDGSNREERALLTNLKCRFSRIFPDVGLRLAKSHLGKGAVIRNVWDETPEAEWLAFVDADGSVAAEDLLMLIKMAISSGTSVLGIRKRTNSTRVVKSPWRSLFHHVFLKAARALLDLECVDPQCGVKILRAQDYRSIAHRLVENGLAFDCELLTNLDRSGARWHEIPVNWTEARDGKVIPLRDCWGMFAALLRIRNRSR